jgi:alkylation response protein AidB-like acyl-CoA dehydrogenase
MSKVIEAEVRAEVRDWLAANWDPDMSLVEWRSRLADSGWGMPYWPKEWYGRDLPHALVSAVEEEFANIEAVGVARCGAQMIAAATLLEHGSDLQKKTLLRRILTGEGTFCLFGEPGSGSDLAGATTRAELKGDFWIINGQKIWTTGAHRADYGLLLARTDWDAPKHEGLSYFVIDVKQPGVDVQPLEQINVLCIFQPGILHRRKSSPAEPGRSRRRRVESCDDIAGARTDHRRRSARRISC